MSDKIGIFGKLPAHGDFIERDLPRSFTTPWDDWVQRCLASSREQIGDNWLDFYLTSPIWRFVASPGSTDNNMWAGILLPSVDSVGRYFPLTFARTVRGDSNIYLTQLLNNEWYSSLESIAISCLQEGVAADETSQRLNNIGATFFGEQEHNIITTANGSLVSHTSNTLEANYATLLKENQQLSPGSNADSQNLWWNSPSSNRDSSLLNCRGLPNSQQYASMITGQWN